MKFNLLNLAGAISWMISACFLLRCSADSTEARTIPYPNPRPDSVALPFLSGVVCSDSLDFNLAFSPDAQTVYFSRSRQGKWVILQSTFDGARWSVPQTSPFSESNYSQADPFVARDGSVYFISNRPRNEDDTTSDFDIWFVRPTDDGKWSPPINLEQVNSDSTEYYVSLASNGSVYFASTRPGGYGGLDIYMSKMVNGNYTTPENLGPAINTSTDEHDPLILAEEQCLIFNSIARPDSFGEADLYYSCLQTNGEWGESKNMGRLFNTPTYEYCPNLSPDGKYFFFSSEYDVKWINTTKLPFTLVKQDSLFVK